MLKIDSVKVSGNIVLPIIEGGKGVSVSNGITSGLFAKAGAVGTISATNADFYDVNGNIVPYTYDSHLTRREKFEQLIEHSITGAIAQIKIARDIAGSLGTIHLNVLWEAGGTRRVLEGVLDKVKGLVNGVTSGAGLPYPLGEISEKYNVHYYPIVSSARAFKVLWKRAYSKASRMLGGVVYEDPWLAGGHNGISNSEDYNKPQDPYPRIAELRKSMNELELQNIPIIIAGGVWHLDDWTHCIDNKEIGMVSFQFGTRPLLTKESPISDSWKKLLLTIKEGDIVLNKFSPTGFYSSAIRNSFLNELERRANSEILVSRKEEGEFVKQIPCGNGLTYFYCKNEDYTKATKLINDGYTMLLRTPNKTVIFVTPRDALQIKEDQINCVGCLHACRFSAWREETGSTGLIPDPSSFCIQKTLQDIGHGGNTDTNLLFSGHQGYRFAQDPYYSNSFIPTINQLVNRIMTGK